MNQDIPMKYDPATGYLGVEPSNANEYRAFHGCRAWLYNPWIASKTMPLTAIKRRVLDIGSDVFGHLINPIE